MSDLRMCPGPMLDELAGYFPDHEALQAAISAKVMAMGRLCRRMAAVEALLIECRERERERERYRP